MSLDFFPPRPAEQQLNLQTALNYSTRCGTTVLRLPGTKAKRSAGLSDWKVAMEVGPVFDDTTSDAVPC